MKVVIRPLDRADLDSVERLRTLVLPHRPESYDTGWNTSIWRWLESHPLAKEEMYRWVLVTDNGEVVGHLAATPQYYRLNGQRVVAHTPTDYMVLPQYGFHAILLMQKFFRTCHNCIACDMFPEVIGVETRLGAEVAGTLQYAVKLWDVSMLPNLPGSIPMPMLKL